MDDYKGIYIDVMDFKGNRIICRSVRWKYHIANDERNHNLDGLETEVIRALTKPSGGMRHYDADYPERRSYYGPGITTRYIKVIVKFENCDCAGTGIMLTAYPTNDMKPNEKPEL